MTECCVDLAFYKCSLNWVNKKYLQKQQSPFPTRNIFYLYFYINNSTVKTTDNGHIAALYNILSTTTSFMLYIKIKSWFVATTGKITA